MALGALVLGLVQGNDWGWRSAGVLGSVAATVVFNVGFGASLLGGILWLLQEWGYSALRTGLAPEQASTGGVEW